MLQKEKIQFVIPVYNEGECIDELMTRLIALRDSFTEVDIEVIFIDDGSIDASLSMLNDYAAERDFVKVIGLSRNFGHQIAVTAGIDHTDADWVCIIDADLQDPPELVIDMYNTAKKKNIDVLYGKRSNRKGETWIKKSSSAAFYRVLEWMCHIKIPTDTGDFRLISRRVSLALKGMRERHRFLRGMVPWVGFSSEAFLYERDERYAGKTKYSPTKMVGLALDAIFSFSRKPLRIASLVGFLVAGAGVAGLAYMVYLKLSTDVVVPGITVILTAVLLVGGTQLMLLGILGEYIGRLYEESKRRPLYLVGSLMNIKENDLGDDHI